VVTETLVDELVDYITRRDWVSFVEISRELEIRGIPTEGEFEIGVPGYANLIMWAGMSEEFVAVLDEMWGDPRIVLDSGHFLAYLIDGVMLTLPIAKRPPKNGYREPHWAPTFFRPRQDLRRRNGER
jgi:hypothetical protein